jgi:hypothetical protein
MATGGMLEESLDSLEVAAEDVVPVPVPDLKHVSAKDVVASMEVSN